MVVSVLIIAISSILFLYWFRYSCLLLLRTRPQRIATAPATEDTRFNFGDVRERLEREEALDPLHSALRRDYEVLIYLVEHASGLELESFEDRLLMLDYRVMQCWYRLTRTAFPTQARQALGEMASVLAVLSRRVTEQAGI